MSKYGRESLSNPHGDRSPWEYHNRATKTFIYEGWLNEVGLIDGHIPASTDKEAIKLLCMMGTFNWLNIRFICTKFNPWNKDISSYVLHQGKWIDDIDGDIDIYECHNCGERYGVS